MHNAILAEAPDAERISSISAVMPACNNEDAAIERSVPDLAGILGRLTTDYEIVVIDDGSRDHTAGVATGARLDAIGRAFKEWSHRCRNLDRELVQDGAARRIPLSNVAMRVPS
jgi:glycosyl transferase family 2